jgi:hypothetical protein
MTALNIERVSKLDLIINRNVDANTIIHDLRNTPLSLLLIFALLSF